MTAADTLPHLDLAPQPVPLTRLPDGTLRVTGTRISLDLVIESYKDGASPETIIQWFDSLVLADVFAVISYYLKHTDEVEVYLRAREIEADALQRQIEAEMPIPAELRQRILDARARMEAAKNGASGE